MALKEHITVLRSKGPLLTKRWTKDGVSPYDEAKHYSVESATVGDIGDLHALLTSLADRPTCCIIRGELRPGMDANYTTRTLSAFEEVPRSWVLIDVDNFESMLFEPNSDPEACINEFVRTKLPVGFRSVSYHWQLSSSAGKPGQSVLKAHLWFWLDKPRNHDELVAWAAGAGCANSVDKTVFRTVQINYTADPVVDADAIYGGPQVARRSGFYDGTFDDVAFVDPKLIEKGRELLGAVGERVGVRDMVDPSQKQGLIGDFCRTYDPTRVINELLSDQFEFQNGSDHRITWLNGGGAAGGACITDDGWHIHNGHNTSPVGPRAQNMWDFVKTYRFAHLDQNVDDYTRELGSAPSDEAMRRFATELLEAEGVISGKTPVTKIGTNADPERRDTVDPNAAKDDLNPFVSPAIGEAAAQDPVTAARAAAAAAEAAVTGGGDSDDLVIPEVRLITIEQVAQVLAPLVDAELIDAWLDQVRQGHIRLDELAEGAACRALAKLLSDLTDTTVSQVDVRKRMRPEAKSRKERQVERQQREAREEASGLPDWLKPIWFIGRDGKFYNHKNGITYTKDSFNLMFAEHPPEDENGMRRAPSDVATGRVGSLKVPKLDSLGYRPGLPLIYHYDGKDYGNTYSDFEPPMGSSPKEAVDAFVEQITWLFEDQREREIMLSWLAWQVQHPGKLLRWAPFIAGGQGCGKSMLATFLSAALGPSNVTEVKGDEVATKFSDWGEGAAVAFIEEFRADGESKWAMADRLKPYVTNNMVKIVPKGGKGYFAFNTQNYCVLSNYITGVPTEGDDRRYLAIRIERPEAEVKARADAGLFSRVAELAIHNPGAIREYLKNVTLHPEVCDGVAPWTAAKDQLKLHSQDEVRVLVGDLVEDKPRFILQSQAEQYVREHIHNLRNGRVSEVLANNTHYKKVAKRFSAARGKLTYVWCRDAADLNMDTESLWKLVRQEAEASIRSLLD